METKKILISFCVVLFIMLLVLNPAWAAKKPYKIGVLLSITGYISFAGTAVRDAVLLEVEKVNAQGGVDGHPIELIIEDDASDTSKAVSGFTKLAKIHGAQAVIGPILARAASIIGKSADKEKVPTLIICPSDPTHRKAGYKYTFNIPQNDIIVAESIVDYLGRKGYKKVVTFPNITDPMFVAIADNIKTFGEKRGLQVFAAPDGYESGAIDMTPQLIKLRKLIDENRIEAMVVCSHGMDGGVIAKNMKTLGMSMPTIGTHAYGFDFTLGIGGEALEGTVFPSGKILLANELPASDPQKAVLVDFINRYKNKYNKNPDQFASHGWDAVHMLVEALKASGGNNKKTRDALEKLDRFIGLTGVFTYKPDDHDGLKIDSLIWYKIEKGEFKLLK